MAVERVASDRFPYLPLTLTVGARTVTLEALIDTGFDGDLAVPMELIADGESPDEYRGWALADGSEIETPVYYGTAWLGRFPSVPADIVIIGDEPLVGRGITDRYLLHLDHGERVIVEP